MTRYLLACLGLTLVFGLGAAQAAKLVPPPLSALVNGNDGKNQIALALAVAPEGQDRYRFKADSVLRGERFDVESVKLESVSQGDIQAGQRYLIVFSKFRRNPMVRDVSELNPDGAVAAEFPEVRSAVFAHAPALEILFKAELENNLKDAARLDATLDVLALADTRARLLAAEEFLLRPRLFANVSPAQLARYQAALADPTLPALNRDFLLQASENLAPEQQGAWQAELARAQLKQHGAQFDLASRIPSLVRTSAQLLEAHGGTGDLPLLEGLLRSNAPGVAKAALSAMDKWDRARAQTVAAGLVGDQSLHRETRLALGAYLKKTAQRP